MILSAYTFNGYLAMGLLTFLLILIDAILTNINARIYPGYYEVEFVPWIRFPYKKLGNIPALIVSLLCSVVVYVLFMLLPISITNMACAFGVMLYRVAHSTMRAIGFRRYGYGGK